MNVRCVGSWQEEEKSSKKFRISESSLGDIEECTFKWFKAQSECEVKRDDRDDSNGCKIQRVRKNQVVSRQKRKDCRVSPKDEHLEGWRRKRKIDWIWIFTWELMDKLKILIINWKSILDKLQSTLWQDIPNEIARNVTNMDITSWVYTKWRKIQFPVRIVCIAEEFPHAEKKSFKLVSKIHDVDMAFVSSDTAVTTLLNTCGETIWKKMLRIENFHLTIRQHDDFVALFRVI